MFRYERPQKGRLRQFHQIGVELLGVPEPQGDVETIALGAATLKALGILEKTTLEINTLGNSASRTAYRAVLVDYFSDHRGRLSEDSQERLERNPLRILDSKDKGDRKIIDDAPSFADYLDGESTEFFTAVTDGLKALGIRYVVNDRLVRGLDYYCHTAFEFTTETLGSQGTVLAGGRYDGLIGMMGGPATPGVGWAAGVERLAMMLEAPEPAPRPVVIVPVGDAAQSYALWLAHDLRLRGYVVEMAFRGNLKRRMAHANKCNARVAVIIGEDELAKQSATVRDLDTGEQAPAPLDGLRDRLDSFF
jgi:histidyl-tRNA synthetase